MGKLVKKLTAMKAFAFFFFSLLLIAQFLTLLSHYLSCILLLRVSFWCLYSECIQYAAK